MPPHRALLLAASVCSALASTAFPANYHVGPGQPLVRLRDVPWATLQPGDFVNIHAQPGGYHEKIQISASGTAAAHIVIRGIPDPVTGALPVIDGQNAIEDPAYDARHPKFTEWSVILVSPRQSTYFYGAYHVSYVDIESLAIQNATYSGDGSVTYRDQAGTVRGYGTFASGIYVEWAHDLTIRGCEISNCGNGIFANSKTQGGQVSRRLLIESNYLHDNSNPPIPNPADPEGVPLSNGFGEHHIYVESAGCIIQYNRFGPLRANAHGTAIKNRSSGIVIRYNEFVMNGESNVIAMPNCQGGTEDIDLQPDYRDAYVYGNLITVEHYSGSVTAFMWGAFDGAPLYVPVYRGTLHLYNNTIINHHEGLTLLLLPGASYTSNATVTNPTYENVDIRNNVIYTDTALQSNIYNAFRFINSGTTNGGGAITLGKNWISPGWSKTAPAQTWSGELIGTGNLIVGDADGLNDPHLADIDARDYRAVSGSNILDASGPLAAAALPANAVTLEYLAPRSFQTRPLLGSASDIGALESPGDPPPPRGVLQLGSAIYNVLENAGSATITVTRTGGSAGNVSVGVGTPGDGGQTAIVSTDYTPQSIFLTWPAGDATPRTIAVPIINDSLAEPSETVRLIVVGPTGGATLGPISEAFLSINDDDTLAAALTDWRSGRFGANAGNALLSGNDADPDADGRSNLLEYALGSDPIGSDPGPLLSTTSGSPGNLQISFNRISAPALTYSVESSADLITWDPTPLWTSTGAQNTAGPVTVTDTANLALTPRRFLRLRVTAP